MNYYQPNGLYNPYFNNQMQNPQVNPNYQQPMQQMQQPVQPYKQQNTNLQGKVVDNIEVVKATDIPLDYTISYFPLTDNSAIVTKQLMQDGTSKIIVYKPVEDEEEIKTPKYLTEDEFKKALNNIDNKDIKDDIKTLKKQFKEISRDIEELKEERE